MPERRKKSPPAPAPSRPSRRAPEAGQGSPAPDRSPNPARIFTIPEEVKYLEPEQLLALTNAFRSWHLAAKRPAGRRARGRVWLTYLLLRYTGARLGEVLALDDRRDLDLGRGVVRLGTGGGRQVQIPEDVVRELAAYLGDPANQEQAGTVLRLDQGYVRRQFYARARECPLPRELANPRVLRNSRAIELLRQGVPLTIVQGILGQGTVNLTANYLSFAEEDSERIVRFHIQKETRLRTSARNSFRGRVTAIRQGPLLAEVEMVTTGGYRIVSVITRESLQHLELRRGSPLTALVKAPWVIIAQSQGPPRISVRNKLRGCISQINSDAVSAEVIVVLDDGTLVCALITGQSLRELGLRVGDLVWTVFKTSAVILTVE